jgi:hypothetical protein
MLWCFYSFLYPFTFIQVASTFVLYMWLPVQAAYAAVVSLFLWTGVAVDKGFSYMHRNNWPLSNDRRWMNRRERNSGCEVASTKTPSINRHLIAQSCFCCCLLCFLCACRPTEWAISEKQNWPHGRRCCCCSPFSKVRCNNSYRYM